MSRAKLELVDPVNGAPDFILDDPQMTTTQQLFELGQDLKRTENDFLTLPLTALAGLAGGLPRGELWYFGAFSGDGKTAFFTSLTLALLEAGKKVYYVPTESPGKVVRGHLACKSLGYDVGDFLSGAYLTWPDAHDAAVRVRHESRRLVGLGENQRLWIGDQGYLDPQMLEAHALLAAEAGVDVMIVDHADHCEDTGRGLYEANVAAQRALLHIAHSHNHLVLAATQFNLDAVKANRALRYMAPRESYVHMGNYKRQICDGMFGLYRCLKRTGLDLKQLQAFKDGDQSVLLNDILEPNTMAVHCMKHRKYGAREGQRIYLHVDHGRVRDFDEKETSLLHHGITTTRRNMAE